MNKVKFRVWDIKKKQWVSDTVVLANDGMLFSVYCGVTEKRDNFVILFFTGIIDKRGIEIFEGDIVFNELSGRYYSVEYGLYDELVGWVIRDVHERAYKENLYRDSGRFLEVVSDKFEELPFPPESFEV